MGRNAFGNTRRLGLRWTALAVFGLALGASSVAAQTPLKILVIAGTSGDHSPMSTAGKTVLEKMGAANGFTIDYSTDHSLLNDANLEKYQVFIQLNLYPFDLSASERAAFEKFVGQGKGWVGIHAAGCAQSSWPWYSKLLGDITWVSHAAFRSGNLIFEDRNHPASKNMPASLIIKDEWYQFSKSPRANVRVLAKADEANYSPFNANGDHPMVWTNPAYPKTIYISIGHDPGDWTTPNYVTLVHDAIFSVAPGSTGIQDRSGARGMLGAPITKAWKPESLVPAGILTADARGRSLRLSASGPGTEADSYRFAIPAGR